MTDLSAQNWLPQTQGVSEPPRVDEPAVDVDPTETSEWIEALDTLIATQGPERAKYLLDRLAQHARAQQVGWKPSLVTPYRNTIPVGEQPRFPGDLDIEQRIAAIVRWNALAMVVRANKAYGELGGHISSYASAADLFEVGFNHFFRARGEQHGGDLVFFQPHSAPGVYARAYLEGRLPESALEHYRQEVSAAKKGLQGLSSYPHPWLMPDFWQFPTGSMGIGPISAIYQARFMRYMEHRGLLAASDRKVWGFFGDGEMDEPESIGALALAARERLDNLVFVINCNLQRLDGPVRGNGRIIDELEGVFTGAGWNVVKVVWGSDWDALFERDRAQALLRAFADTVDGEFQTLSSKDGRYNRERFFGQSPELAALVEAMTDAEIDRLHRGGHDIVKVHAAFRAAVAHRGQPTVILAKTMKGYGMGSAGQGRMTTHQQKKLDPDAVLAYRDRFSLPLTDEQALSLAFYRPGDDSDEMRYLQKQRARLGGYLPARRSDCAQVPVPPVGRYAGFALAADGKEMSTTMAFVRMLGQLLKDPALGPRIVPIVADEARTFGMANLFRQVGIYSPHGQRYEPEDAGSMLYYREDVCGQILEEGITEAGALSSWTAAATSYSTHGQPMLPFYIYYSIFGFQRVGDLIWAAADQRPRGFLIGATSGRTTLAGEGLQHQDGSSHLHAMTVPNCKAWDPAFAGELAVIVDAGMREMLVEQRDVFHYVTVGNENYAQPSLPGLSQGGDGTGIEVDPVVREGILRGMYRFRAAGAGGEAGTGAAGAAAAPAGGGRRRSKPAAPRVQLLGAGAILREAIGAAELLEAIGIAADIWSVTSFSELARDGMSAERRHRLALAGSASGDVGAARPADAAAAAAAAGGACWVQHCLAGTDGPIVAATDYVRLVPESIRAWLPEGRRYVTLGTDGFGRSDARARLREFFEVDAKAIAWAAVVALCDEGVLTREQAAEAASRWNVAGEAADPWTV
ncbi:pyruvate dehydrogenase (acetyl-transferring), homodimeric type [Burkholderiaceae bacterium FT117]|uniref:pyruvate dehydrogenase (acetyl-transferring), homodimeric type n=1 Tax=Zeimonas sediminis TaxID=2944268 RepID=UPI002342F339|nr:pyruvate dehydrogenase (acetyl-transferring), homodimeric type [Zeimonas sediminis]MCM5571473.1 pyruvate dehydrogenase (acetyl-transferring), homodimeric type [Zeimonas sediminis]